jgi:hypothetical protein
MDTTDTIRAMWEAFLYGQEHNQDEALEGRLDKSPTPPAWFSTWALKRLQGFI